MKIHYQNEYGDYIYVGESEIIPRIGESVMFKEEDYFIKNVIWAVEEEMVVIVLSQTRARVQEKDDTSGRLKNLDRAIVNINKRIDEQDVEKRKLNERVRTLLSNNLKDNLKGKTSGT